MVEQMMGYGLRAGLLNWWVVLHLLRMVSDLYLQHGVHCCHDFSGYLSYRWRSL